MGHYYKVHKVLQLAATLKTISDIKLEAASSNFDLSSREKALSVAKTVEAKRFISQQYRQNAKIGDGSTAAAVEYELTTGKLVGGKSHIQKAKNAIRRIKNMLKENPNHPDRALLWSIKERLEKALKGE